MYKILSLCNSLEWKNYLSFLQEAQNDIYFSPEYYSLCELNGEGEAKCFVYENDGEIAIYPFLLNSVNDDLRYELSEKYFDIQGGYGYNGFLCSTDSAIFIEQFSYCFDNYCNQNNIIAEFLRINPVMSNLFLKRPNFKIIHDRDNVNIDLLKGDLFESEYDRSTKKNIKKAVKSGLSFRSVLGSQLEEIDLNAFCSIYEHTMQRNNADEFYYFNNNYFADLATSLGNKALFVFVLFESKVISCELVLLGSKIAYSFLGGTLADYYQYRPNDFLKHETIKLLKEMKFENFLLGGGSEGVLKYKASFSKTGKIPFFIGKKIHNEKIYNEIVHQWENKFPEKVEQFKNILLKYRY